jgi:hypothetical protein
MAKRSKGISPGVHWIPGEEGWIPRFVWRKAMVEGPPRPAQAFLPQEPFRVVMEFANLSGKAIFGVAPYHTVQEKGREVFQANPAFDKIPDMKALLGGLSKPGDIEIKDRSQPSLETPEGIPVDQIDPKTLPQSKTA